MTNVKYIIEAHPRGDVAHKTSEMINGDSLAKRWTKLLRDNGWIVTSVRRVA